MSARVFFQRLTLVTISLLTIPTALHAEDSNRNEVRANLEKDGWSVIWGKNFTEADWVRGTKAIAESVATENPGPFLAWFEATLDENFAKIQRNLEGVSRADLNRWVAQSLKVKKIITYNGLDIQAGFATYDRWNRVVYDEPRSSFEMRRDPITGIKTKVPVVTTVRVEKKVNLPNWHQFYIRYKLKPVAKKPVDKVVKLDYTIRNDAQRTVNFKMQPSGKSYSVAAGKTFTGTSHQVNGKAPTITLSDSGRTFSLTEGNHKFWWMAKEKRVGFDRSTD